MSRELISFSDVLEEMVKRGDAKEALSYQVYVLLHLGMLHGFSEERIMQMTVDEVVRHLVIPPRPLKYRNWDSFYWGEVAFR